MPANPRLAEDGPAPNTSVTDQSETVINHKLQPDASPPEVREDVQQPASTPTNGDPSGCSKSVKGVTEQGASENDREMFEGQAVASQSSIGQA